MNIEDLNKTRDLLLKINTLLIEESKCSEASLDSYKTLTSIVKEIQALEIPNNDKIIDYTCNFIVDEAGIEQFQLTSKSIIEQCEFFFEKYNSSKLSEKYSFKNLEDILQNLYYKPHFRKEEIEKEKWGRIYNDIKNNPNAVQEDALDVPQNLQVVNTNLDSKMSETLFIYNQHICNIISDPYKEEARLIRPLYTFQKKKDTEVEPPEINQQNLPEKKKRGRPPKEKLETIYQYFINDTEYDQLKERLYEFFKYRKKKVSSLDMQGMYRELSAKNFFTKQASSINEFAKLLVNDTGKEIYSGSIKSIYQKKGRITNGFIQSLKDWLTIIESNRKS